MYRYVIPFLAATGLIGASAALGAQEAADAPKNPERPKKMAFLGVQAGESPDGQNGALVENIMPKSPAAKTGLKRGDRIVRVDDQTINGPRDLIEAVRKAGVGKEVAITAQRGDQKMQFKAKLEEAPRELLGGPGTLPGGPGSLRPIAPQMIIELPERVQQLQQRVDDLERRLRALEQKKQGGEK